MTQQYSGFNAATGNWLTDLAHLRQSVADILTTPVGTRLMRRDYGSEIPELLDAPMSPVILRLKIISAACQALAQWEPRLTLKGIDVTMQAGRAALTISGYTRGHQTTTFTIIINPRGTA
ncbi:GPW/gp25 family protein [Escherichia coli]|uniref:GPW/gp25 family protein n=1 Tax=Escherichia coli TaxID=562 RepID=UPI00135EAADB|nr:GPW/gp25 family protein [Escherichia coli]MXF04487.1 hypothetical protein [Escherichia coli]